MNFSRFNLWIIIQVILIGITTSFFVWTLSQEFMLITRYSLVAAWLIQIYILFNFINRISRDLNKFLLSIKYKDTSIRFNVENNHPFKELHQGFEEIISAFETVRVQKEYEYHFFQTAIEHVNVGIFAFTSDGKIKLCNKAALQLLGLRSLSTISSLQKVSKSLPRITTNLKPNKAELINLKNEYGLSKLSLNATELKIKEEQIKLVSVQNITQELEQGEMDAWQKLIKVITHEILNSVSPINLLASGLLNIFEEEDLSESIKKLDVENMEELLKGLKLIKNRSKSLSSFVDDYRTAMQIPAPKFEQCSLNDLIHTISVLFKEEFIQKKIVFIWEKGKNVEVIADKKLIEQVLINLINNAIYFVKDVALPIIEIKAIADSNQILIIDNGLGIDEENIDQIFIPFFSTKEKGSGIGLSLSRQIMRMHNGSISVESVQGEGSTFTLTF